MLLVKPIFPKYCRKFWGTTPSAVMPKEDLNTLLSFQIFLIPWDKYSYFCNFLCSVEKAMGHQNFYIYYKCCFFLSLLMSTIFGLLKSSFYQLS
jgi:hypothetical protein